MQLRDSSTWWLGAFALVALCVWGAGLGAPFQFDDFTILDDPATTDLPTLLVRLATGIRPLLRLSFFLDYAIWGSEPLGFHLPNFLLHACSTLLVFLLGARLLQSKGAGLFAAALFVAQPANAETVVYVSGRSMGLSTALLLLSLVLLDASVFSSRKPLLLGCGAVLAAVAACLTRETAVVFPLLHALWLGLRLHLLGRSWKDCIAPRLLSLLVMEAAGLVVAGAQFLHSERLGYLVRYSVELRSPTRSLLANGVAVWEEVSLLFRPWALSVVHQFDPSRVTLGMGLAGLVAVAAVAVAALAIRRRLPWLAFGVIWTLVALAPTNSLLAKLDLVTEKPLYLVNVGVSLALAVALSTASRFERVKEFVAWSLLAVLLAFSVQRVHVWRDHVALWAEAVEKNPASSRARNNLGMAYYTRGEPDTALRLFREAVRLDPRNDSALHNVQEVATELAKKGQLH